MFTYLAYGLGVKSQIPLLEFTPASGSGEIIVTYTDHNPFSALIRERDDHVEIRADEACFWFRKAGCFTVRRGSSIEVNPNPDADEAILRLYVEGMMMAMALYQRGLCVLHASVIKIEGAAVGFLGHVGAGKSSVAAALHARGHALVSDDNAAISFESGTPFVFPAYPYIKLFPQIALSLGYTGSELRELHSTLPKVAGNVCQGFTDSSLPLKALYVLGRDYPEKIARLDQQHSVIELIRNSVPTRWGCRGDAKHLLQCGRLATQVPVFTIRTFEDLSSLKPLAESLEKHYLLGSPVQRASKQVIQDKLARCYTY